MKNLLPVLMLCILFFSCADEKSNAKTDVRKEAGEKNIALTRELVANMNKQDWKAVAAFYVDSPMMMTSPDGVEFKKSSHNEIIEQHTGLANMIKDLRFDITSIVADSNRVAYEFTATGIINGRKNIMPLSCFATFENGKITRDATYFDE